MGTYTEQLAEAIDNGELGAVKTTSSVATCPGWRERLLAVAAAADQEVADLKASPAASPELDRERLAHAQTKQALGLAFIAVCRGCAALITGDPGEFRTAMGEFLYGARDRGAVTPEEAADLGRNVEAAVAALAALPAPGSLGTLRRVRMDDRRTGNTMKVTVAGWDIYVTVNFYDNNQPGEVFITVGKGGSVVSGLMDSVAMLISMLLQVGVPIDRICTKLEHTRFEPSDSKFSSFVDAVARTMRAAVSDRGGQADKDYQRREIKW